MGGGASWEAGPRGRRGLVGGGASLVNQMSGGVDLTQRQLVVVFIVENIHQIGVERMDVLPNTTTTITTTMPVTWIGFRATTVEHNAGIVRYQRNDGIDPALVVAKVILTVNLLICYLLTFNGTVSNSTYLQLWEVIKYVGQLVVKVLLRELYFAYVKSANARYLVVLVNDSRCLALCS